MSDREIATNAVGAGCARVQTEPFWDRLPSEQKNPSQRILDREHDPAQYCWDAFRQIRLGNPEMVPEHLSSIIIGQLQSEAIRDTVTIGSAMKGGTILHVLKDKS